MSDLFRKLANDSVGKHEIHESGTGHEREFTTKPYEWGDPFNLHIEQTIRNAITRSGGGTPVQLTPPTTSKSNAPNTKCDRRRC